MAKNYDFSGWATRNDIRCSDGRTIRKDAFKECDGQTVPLVWNHGHNDNFNVLGHALLENRDEGVYTYCSFNDTESGRNAKLLVEHGDIDSLSIYANKLQQHNGDVLHGTIREVSLVLAGANPGAYIDSIISHGEESEEEAVIYNGEEIMIHNATPDEQPEETVEHADNGGTEMAEEKKVPAQAAEGEETVADVFNTLTEKQKKVVYAMVGMALEEANNEKGDDENMKHNAFDDEEVIAHDDLNMEELLADAKRCGSMKEAFLAHAVAYPPSETDHNGNTVTYGIANIDYLFPDARQVGDMALIKRPDGWVTKVMNGAKHTPFSRLKSLAANITANDARARGYVKGDEKIEEVIVALKRVTEPQTIYKKQKLDRDDIIDITDMDVVAFLKKEMRMLLDEEIARAALIGDGRPVLADDKIKPDHIRPIWGDDATYSVNQVVTLPEDFTDDVKAKALIRAAIKARKDYRGSGNPTFFTTEDLLTDMLLLEDVNGRVIYDTEEKLRTALRVKEIVTVPVMENQTRTVGTDTRTLQAIIVNMNDYTFGADKGGAVTTFEDFDIDFNQEKYLIETRVSGALTVPYSAIVLETVVVSEEE